ncbi:glucose-6-phosphate 1-dehydrogenase [Kordiimonas sediminis]|uniref:Glucose-6-phosphate 1-dehydrogenase n=2 Tax=Kordiimonas sediminis TaxID=1735581 RepID=A0A919AQN1_9PROT|nr:glucose-6-phosphate 1-dehydrogenase [Kordiimonas sediminis]
MEMPFDLVIFGGFGDLSRKKLLPALYAGFVAGHLPPDTRIYLTSRKPLTETVPSFLQTVFDETIPACPVEVDTLNAFARQVIPIALDLSKAGDDWTGLQATLSVDHTRPLVHFLAVPPRVFTSTTDLLGQYALNTARARIVLEKPLGHDRESARAINDAVAKSFTEEQTFRIDHYLGKEAVQNLLALRFSNILFEELWNKNIVDHVQITIAEDQGVKGRAEFYEGIGAMRDMVQSHLLQLLCLVSMEAPATLDAASIREEKLKVLRCLKPLSGSDIDDNVVRGQYAAGAIKGQAVGAYTEDLRLEAPSRTETFVAIKAHIENWRWAGVPFYLRTGKRMTERFAEIIIQFKCVPHAPQKDWQPDLRPNKFVIRLQPEDHLALRFMVKHHGGVGDKLREVDMNLDENIHDGAVRLGPYLRLILDAAAGNQSLFVHRDEVGMAWQWVDRIVEHWDTDASGPVDYPAGTWGPYEAHDLLARDGRKWYRL